MKEKNIKNKDDSKKTAFVCSLFRTIKLLYCISSRYFIISMIFTLLIGISSAMSVYATKILINALQSNNSNSNSFFIMLIIYGLINISISVIQNLQNYISEKHRLFVDSQMDTICLEKCSHLGLKDFEDENIYNVINRANELGRTKIFELYINMLSLIQSIVSIAAIYTVIANIDKYLFLLVLIVPIISTFSNIKIGKLNYHMLKKRTLKNRQLSYINYLLTNNIAIKEILSYRCHHYFIEKFKAINREILKESNRFIRLRTVISIALSLFEELLSITVILCVMIMAGTGKLLIGDTVAYINSLSLIGESLKSFMMVISTIYSDRLYIEDFFVFMDLEQDEQDDGKEVENIHEIVFKNVSFSYGTVNKDALKTISLRIDHSGPVAIIGENGSGKTTLIKLIAGLYKDYSGYIYINGTEMREIKLETYQARLGIIFQDFNKYELTMRENIGIADIGKIENDEELYSALRIVNMEQVIGKNIDVQMGSWFGGNELSKGQWQRIAIARTIIRDSDVLVLDEPTSALDPIMEREIFRLIKAVSKQKILIFITHRISNLLEFDPYIFVMNSGKIVSQGNQEDLKEDIHFHRLLSGKDK